MLMVKQKGVSRESNSEKDWFVVFQTKPSEKITKKVVKRSKKVVKPTKKVKH